jgi:cobalt-zinc-cadmium efflux system membrane fusion protein
MNEPELKKSRATLGAALLATGALGAAALACIVMYSACSSGPGEKANEMTSYSSKSSASDTPELFTIPQEQMSHVKVVTVEPTLVKRDLRLSGAVAYNQFKTTPVISQVGGPVSRILVVPGQHVREGQPMLEVTSPDYSLLFAAYLKARDTLRVAQKNYDRAKDLYDHHAIAERDLLQAESDQIQAQADLNAAVLGLKILGIQDPEELAKKPTSTAEIPVLAPISGEVVERDVSPGQLLTPGATQAFVISDMSSVWILVNVYQGDLSAVHVGDAVDVTTDSYPDTFRGKISFISPALDPNTRTLQARIVVENAGEKLKNNMYCVATVAAGAVKNAIALPDSAILRDDENQPYVYVENSQNQFGRRQVEIGDSTAGQTQILKGLSPGEHVVGDGGLFLQFANSLQH